MGESEEAVNVQSPSALEKMPQIYRELLETQLMIHTEGELSGADDYVHLLYPLAPNAAEKRICCERAIEELDHFNKGSAVLMGMGIDVSYMLRQKLEERHLYVTDAVQDVTSWEERGLFSFLGEGAVLHQLNELADSSYRPLAEMIPGVIRDELVHVAHGVRVTKEFCRTAEGLAQVNEAMKKWWPRTLALFGPVDLPLSREYVRWGLRTRTNGE